MCARGVVGSNGLRRAPEDCWRVFGRKAGAFQRPSRDVVGHGPSRGPCRLVVWEVMAGARDTVASAGVTPAGGFGIGIWPPADLAELDALV